MAADDITHVLLMAGFTTAIISVMVAVGDQSAVSYAANEAKIPNVSLTIHVEGPKTAPVQSGKGGLIMTTYLPVNITQTINLSGPAQNLTLYPIFERWDGVVRTENLRSALVDSNQDAIPRKEGITVPALLHGVNATCMSGNYFVNVTNSAGFENGGVRLENTTKPVSSWIAWGGPDIAVFIEPQSGPIYYNKSGYGIVPADYNDDYDKIFENNGGGNQRISGTYHLSFVSFFPASVDLPEPAERMSFRELSCSINEDSPYVSKSRLPIIYVYDVLFKIE